MLAVSAVASFLKSLSSTLEHSKTVLTLKLELSFLKRRLLSLLCSKPPSPPPFHKKEIQTFVWPQLLLRSRSSTIIPVFNSFIYMALCYASVLKWVKHTFSCPKATLYTYFLFLDVLSLIIEKACSIFSLRSMQKCHFLRASFSALILSVSLTLFCFVFLHSTQ